MQEYTLQTIAVGIAHSFDVTVTDAMMRSFETMTGDQNPLHVDAAFSAARGHRAPVVYGMLVASFYSTLVGVYLPGRNALLQEVNVSFRQPVYAGNRLTVRGQVVVVSAAARQIDIKAEIVNQDGCKVSQARIKVGIPSD